MWARLREPAREPEPVRVLRREPPLVLLFVRLP